MKLIDEVLSKDNLNQAYLQVTRNKGASGIDDMTCEEVKDYLKVHGNELISQIKSREYKPLPVRRVWQNGTAHMKKFAMPIKYVWDLIPKSKSVKNQALV